MRFVRAGYQAQLDSIVLLKNKNGILPLKSRPKVYVPDRHIRPRKGFFRNMEPEQTISPLSRSLASEYFELVSRPEEADAEIVFIESPVSADGGYDGKSYVPISLQYRPYQALQARYPSIAGSSWKENDQNRSYRGRTAYTANEEDLDLVIQARKDMKDKPVIVCITMHNPAVCSEFEPFADAVIADFDVSRHAVLDLITGRSLPKGRLPFQLPADMDTVERHMEDKAFDLTPYTDTCGHRYDYGYGMDFSGNLLK